MHFIFFILIGWFIQYSESNEEATPFTISATVWDPKSNVDHMQCEDSDTVCKTYKDCLCNNLTDIASLNMIPEILACDATPVTTWENGTTKWSFVLYLVTKFTDGPGVNLTTCPTFGRLFSAASKIKFSYIKDPYFSFTIDDYSPKPQAQSDIGFITSPSIQYQVTARLEVDELSTAEGLIEGPITTELVEKLLAQMYTNSGIGDLLLPDIQSNMSNLNVTIGDVTSVSFTLTFSKEYLDSISINTYCDIASILRLSLIDGFQIDGYTPLSVTVELLSTATLPTMTTPSLASTLGYPIKTLLLAYAASRILTRI